MRVRGTTVIAFHFLLSVICLLPSLSLSICLLFKVNRWEGVVGTAAEGRGTAAAAAAVDTGTGPGTEWWWWWWLGQQLSQCKGVAVPR